MRSTLIVLLLVLAGCATLTPAQEASLADMKMFARRVTDAYHVAPVYIQVGELADRAGARMMPGGLLQIYPNRLSLSGTQGLVAHELAHYVLAHRSSVDPAVTARQEMEANAEAVRVMAVGAGIPEAEAYQRIQALLWGLQESIVSGTRTQPRGHAPICQEIADLAKRYPQYPAKTCDATAAAQPSRGEEVTR